MIRHNSPQKKSTEEVRRRSKVRSRALAEECGSVGVRKTKVDKVCKTITPIYRSRGVRTRWEIPFNDCLLQLANNLEAHAIGDLETALVGTLLSCLPGTVDCSSSMSRTPDELDMDSYLFISNSVFKFDTIFPTKDY